MGGFLRRFWLSLLGTLAVLVVFLAGAIGGAALFVGLGSAAYSRHWVGVQGREALEGIGEVACAIGAAIAVRIALYTVPRGIYRRRLPRLRTTRQRVRARINKLVPLHGLTNAGFQDSAMQMVRCRMYIAWRDPERTDTLQGCWRTYRFRTKEEAAEFVSAYPEGTDIWVLLKRGHPSRTIPDTPYAPRWREMW